MADALFSSFHLNQIQRDHGHLTEYGADEQVADHDHEGKQQNANWFETEDGPYFHSLYDVDLQNFTGNHQVNFFQDSDQITSLPQCWVQNDHFHHNVTPALQPIYYHATKNDDHIRIQPQQQLPEIGNPPLKEKPHSFSLASLELPSNFGKGFKSASDEILTNNNIPTDDESSTTDQKLSLGEIVKVAGERYIQFSTQRIDGFSAFIHPYGSSISDLSIAETENVELVQLLLIAAECVGHRQFDLASSLITRCLWIASDSGNATQRIVFYFAEALQQRIEMETGRTTPERMMEQLSYAMNLELDFSLSFLALHQALPIIQVTQFAAMQSIIDNLKAATKIHLIDLHIRSGVQWTVLMQALAERDKRPALKITAVGTTNKRHIEETGKRLMTFAQSLTLSLSFNVVIVSDMKELKEDMFKKEADEAVAVYSSLILRTMISKPDSLGNVIKVMRRLRPSLLVVIEVEANHNSPSFVSRFTESLFFYSAFFDCLEDCMERSDEHRKTIEAIYLGEGIRNMVGTEGDKRCTRNVNIDVWREFFARYGLAEVELSDSSLRHANMILKKFRKAGSCNLINNGKGFIVGWKGTPIHSLTTWKFM